MSRTCAICGGPEGTTRDHIPPKSIFPRPLPEDLITVPACVECNNGASAHDEMVKVLLSFGISEPNEVTERTLRTFDNNNRLLRDLQEECRELGLVDPDGNIAMVDVVQWNSEAHDKVIERIVRGLYFNHSGHPVPSDQEVKVQFLREIPPQVINNEMLLDASVGDNQFKYKYIIDPNTGRSTWVFDFYGVHFASGYTQPIG